MKFTYKNDLDELKKLANDIELFSKKEKLSDNIIYHLNLCLDEILTNVISYSLNPKFKGEETIEIELKAQEEKICIKVKDKGAPFNPFTEKNLNPDITSDINKRNIGGLGVFFIDQYMDYVKYERIGNYNIIYLEKNISTAKPKQKS